MKKKLAFIAAMLLALCTPVVLLCFDSFALVSEGFELTPEEAGYLRTLSGREIVLAETSELMSFTDSDGKPTGILLPLVELLRDEWGLNIKSMDAGWGSAFGMIDKSEADLMGFAALTLERRDKYYSTGELFAPNMAVYTRNSDPLINVVNMAGKQVGTLAGSAITQMIREYIEENTVIHEYGEASEMFEALENGEIDCAVSSLNVERELLRHPKIRHEMIVESVRVPQALYSANHDMAPLIGLINRYLSSSWGEKLRSDIELAHEESVLKAAKLEFFEEIKDLNENYGELRVYDSSVLYPLAYIDENGEYKGFQLEVNNVFSKLTGRAIDIRYPSEFDEGFITAIDEIEKGSLVGATSVYFNKGYSLDPTFEFSVPIMSDKLGFYSIKENPGKLSELRIGTTKFGSAYIDWQALTGNDPVIFGNRGDLLTSLKRKELDAIFISEMTADYYYSVKKDYSLIQISGVTAPANFHMLMNASNTSFNKLFNTSIMLQEIIHPYSREQWMNVPRDYKFAFMRVRRRLESYEAVVAVFAVLLIGILAAMYFTVSYHLKKFSTYDTQISRMLTLQKNADMFWGNIKTGEVVSKGDFPILRKWGTVVDHEERFDSKAAENFVLSYGARDLEELKSGGDMFICHDEEVISLRDGSSHYARRYTHKISDHEFMVFVLDVTEEKHREHELYKIANIDFLSELLTRRAMDSLLTKRAEAIIPGDKGLYVMMLDIDDFKNINDSYGHDIGDMVLMSIAEIIKTGYPECPAARWGGEEFLLLAETAKLEDAVAIAEDILDKVEQKVFEVGVRTSFSVTLSCGISMMEGPDDYPDVVSRSDAAMYRAKAAGKNCIRILKR